MSKFAKHGQKYILADGTIAPSVTTYINDLGWNKQTLINYTKRLTFSGLDADKVLQDLAETGTLLHLMIEGSIKGFKVDTKDFTYNQEKQALKAFVGYTDWVKKVDFKPLASEVVLINEEQRVGGTVDCIGRIGDDLVVIDWKTSKYGPYKEHIIQIAQYVHMYEQAQPKANVAYGMILRFGKEDGKFHQHKIKREKIDAGVEIFKHLVALRNLKSKV